MERKKLTPEEIQVLRADAEKERAAHRQVISNLSLTTMSSTLQMMTVVSSYERMRESEVLLFLAKFAKVTLRYELSDAVKMFIYERGDEFPKAKAYMLQHNHLGYLLEKRIIDDNLSPFYKNAHDKMVYPKFADSSERYLVERTLNACQRANKLSDELRFLTAYTSDNKLCHCAETSLMDFLTVTTVRDSVIDTLESFVLSYIGCHEDLAPDAQLRMIKSGNHKVIMYYITHSKLGIDNAVVDALLERADAEEVTAYFKRYAKQS